MANGAALLVAIRVEYSTKFAFKFYCNRLIFHCLPQVTHLLISIKKTYLIWNKSHFVYVRAYPPPPPPPLSLLFPSHHRILRRRHC
jgi:hypothetical protein